MVASEVMVDLVLQDVEVVKQRVVVLVLLEVEVPPPLHHLGGVAVMA